MKPHFRGFPQNRPDRDGGASRDRYGGNQKCWAKSSRPPNVKSNAYQMSKNGMATFGQNNATVLPGTINVSSNQWRLFLPETSLVVHRSDVSISNAKNEIFKLTREEKWEILHTFFEKQDFPHYDKLVYDGEKILISRTPIRLPHTLFNHLGRTFSLEINYTGLSTDLSKILDPTYDDSFGFEAVNQILLACARQKNLLVNSRNFVPLSPDEHDVKPMTSIRTRSIIFGHMQAVYKLCRCTVLDNPIYRPLANSFQKPTEKYLSLVLNPSCAVFITRQPFSQYCSSTYGVNLLKDAINMEATLQFHDIKGLKAETCHVLNPETREPSKRTFTIDSIAFDKTAATYKITYEEKSLSLVTYFKARYNITLKYLHAPLIQMKPVRRNTFLPMELVYISHQRVKNLNDEAVKAELATSLIMGPADRVQYTNKKRKLFDGNPVLYHYGLKAADQPNKFNAVVLAPPVIQYRGMTHVPRGGAWNMANKCFILPKDIPHLCIVSCVGDRDGNVASFCSALLKTAREVGFMSNIRHTIMWSSLRSLSQLKSTLKSQQNPPKFILFILPRRNTEDYALIKNLFAGFIPSACVVADRTPLINPRKHSNSGHYANILCKINKKLCGINHSILLKSSSLERLLGNDGSFTIVSFSKTNVGRFAYHREEWQTVACALVMSCKQTQTFSQQTWIERENASGTDFVRSFQQCLRSGWGIKASHWPKRIVLFLEGIPESSLLTGSNDTRVHSIKTIYKNEKVDEPRLTVISFYRTHALRFFQHFSSAQSDANIPPGTTLYDSCITEGAFPNFFLVPHSGIKGTSRCPHYYIIFDELSSTNKLNLLFWITFCFEQCYLYETCQRAVSCVASSFYARKLLDRTQLHLKMNIASLMNEIDKRSRSASSETVEKTFNELNITIIQKLDEMNKKINQINDSSNHLYFI